MTRSQCTVIIQLTVVNEPSVFEPSKFYCILFSINLKVTSFHVSFAVRYSLNS